MFFFLHKDATTRPMESKQERAFWKGDPVDKPFASLWGIHNYSGSQADAKKRIICELEITTTTKEPGVNQKLALLLGN